MANWMSRGSVGRVSRERGELRRPEVGAELDEHGAELRTEFARAIEERLAGDAIARLHRRARENEWPRILAELVLPVIHA